MSNPLVSVVVISYNASKTIVETLDSIKAQTYSPLELIIAEDHSTDDTALKCKQWLAENSNRFVKSKLIINEKNLGVTANVNSGIRASSGKWIKGLGDDVLLNNAIEKNIAFAEKNDSDIVVSKMLPFMDETREPLNIIPANNYIFPTTNNDQYMALIKGKLNSPSPTWFFSKELYNRVGGFDERFRLSDDIPFCYKILENGGKFSFLPEITVSYRITSNSLSNNKNQTGEQKRPYFESRLLVYRELQAPALKKNKLYSILIRNNLWWFFYKKKIYSRDNSLTRYFYGALCTLVKH